MLLQLLLPPKHLGRSHLQQQGKTAMQMLNNM
jgi:hypothetical protein